MGAPAKGMEAADQPAAETLLDAFKTISAAERRTHASVLNYWLSIRGDKEFPPLHDLDPLELSDAGPNSILLELISGGHDAEVRHLGEALRFEGKAERIIDAPNPSILACVAKKLPIVAISRDFLAFEDEYDSAEGKVRCWATLLPLSAGGAWVDYVYALVTFEAPEAKAAKPKGADEAPRKSKSREAEPETVDEAAAEAPQPERQQVDEPVAAEVAEPQPEEASEPAEAIAEVEESQPEELPDALEETAAVDVEPEKPAAETAERVEDNDETLETGSKTKPGFSKLFDNLVGLTGFYGHGYQVDGPASAPGVPERPAEGPVEEEREPEAAQIDEGPLADPVADEAPAEPPVAEEAPLEQPPAPETIEDMVEEPVVTEIAEEPAAVEPAENVIPVAAEGPLKNKLADVRVKADEARQAKLRANVALYDGLSAAYDFALDAEDAPEEYLRLVEAEGLKIQLRSPMRPVVKLAFSGLCDDSTIKQLEAVLAWALDNELPRGSLAEQIEAAGGIGPILTGDAKAAA